MLAYMTRRGWDAESYCSILLSIVRERTTSGYLCIPQHGGENQRLRVVCPAHCAGAGVHISAPAGESHGFSFYCFFVRFRFTQCNKFTLICGVCR